jgi:hypothetical protein
MCAACQSDRYKRLENVRRRGNSRSARGGTAKCRAEKQASKNRPETTGRNAQSVALRHRTRIYAGFAEDRYFRRVAEVRRAGEAFPRGPRAISEVSRLNSARFSLATLGGRESKCSCRIRVALSAAKSNLDFLLLMGLAYLQSTSYHRLHAERLRVPNHAQYMYAS